MQRQLVCILLAFALASAFGVDVRAAEGEGTISVTVEYEDGKVHDGELTLYHVGNPREGGYRLLDAYGGGLVMKEDIYSPMLAKWLAESAQGIRIPRILDADGNVCYSGLSEGLYLLVQNEPADGYEAVEPFLIPVPCYGQWNVTAIPKARMLLTEPPETGQHPAPIIGAMGLVISGLALVVCADKFRKK